MLGCSEVTRTVASDELASLGWRRRLAIRMHLLICANCRRYAGQIRRLGDTARELLGPEPPAERLRALEGRILDRVKRSDDHDHH